MILTLQPILDLLESVIGSPPDYFTVGTAGNNIQWHYGQLMEYFFAGMLCLLAVTFIFRIIIKLFERG